MENGTMKTRTLKFIKGMAIVRQGRKPVAKIIDREVFFLDTPILLEKYNKKYPFSVSMDGIGQKECATLAECCEAVKEYTGIEVCI